MLSPMQQQTIEWLANGETGISSKTMAFWLAFDIKMEDGCHPWDPADFDRCLKLLEWVPEMRTQLYRMKEISPQWAALVTRWSDIECSHLEEAGIGWWKARSAPKTYELMKSVLRTADEVSDR